MENKSTPENRKEQRRRHLQQLLSGSSTEFIESLLEIDSKDPSTQTTHEQRLMRCLSVKEEVEVLYKQRKEAQFELEEQGYTFVPTEYDYALCSPNTEQELPELSPERIASMRQLVESGMIEKNKSDVAPRIRRLLFAKEA